MTETRIWVVVQFAVAALCERRKPLRIKTAVIDRRYNKIKLTRYPAIS
jgi:hypothetical protein